MAGERWVFTAEQLENTPSRKCGIDSDKETYYRQQAANFVQDMGQRLQVTQLCINTAIVYLHRFYMFHSFTKFHRNSMAEACLFLAAKVEEQPRKLEHVIKVAHAILHRDQGPLDTKSVAYLEHAQELVLNENILLQTLGFELQVDHPHKHIVETCNLIRAAKDLAQTSYFLATNSLHLTQMSLQYKPTFVASICIHLACKWAQFEIPRSNEGKEWFSYVDKSMTAEILEGLTQKFLSILDKCPTKFKKKLMSKTGKDEEIPGFTMPQEKKVKAEPSASATSGGHERGHGVNNHDPSTSGSKHPHKSSDHSKASAAAVSTAKTSDAVKQEGAMRRVKTESYLTSLSTKEYFERKEKERQERERIERERQKIAAEKEKEEKAAAAKAAKEAAMAAAAEKSKTSRHHTNIFEEMASGSAVKVEPAIENTTTVEKPKEKHSTERSNVSHSYKDKYHDKPDGAAAEKQAPRKLPFSVDYNKLQEYQRPKSSSSHSRHEGHSRSGYKSHGEHRSSHGAPPSEFRSQAERSHGSREQSRHEKRVENPVTEHKVPEAAVTAASSAAPKPPIDPEEGEILDDDSPPDLSVKKHLSSSSSSHGHRHHHRERRSSGHHHHTSPASASAAATSGEQRRKSPRNGRKEEAAPTSHHKKHAEEAPSVVPTPAPLPIDVDKLFEDVRRPTPEPGEIVEKQQQQQQQSHKHHKSSHKSHKKRNKEREDPTSGSLKMKIDLKGVGKIPSPATDDRKSKEVKLKIKPVTGDPAATSSQPRDGKVRTSSSTKPQEHHHKVRESPSSLKVKLKLPSSATTTGNGETEAHTPKDQKSLSGSSSSIKLVLSKDSLGQYTPTGSGSSSSHKSHKHSDKSSSSSRKRPFSPSDAGAPLKHKLARNDSSSGLVTRPAVELPGSVSGSPLTGAPFTGTPSRESLSTTMSLMDALIKQKAGELYQRAPSNSSKKHRHATPPSDNPDIL